MAEPLDIPDGIDGHEEFRYDMVRRQITERGIRDEGVLRAMQKVPRHLFVPPEAAGRAYDDTPLAIGGGQTISQPYIVALMTEALDLSGTERVLEIGTGCGYQTAILAELAGQVYSVEYRAELAEGAADALRRRGWPDVHFATADGSFGWADHAPYDRIIVTACAISLPAPLADQLAFGGTIVIPIGSTKSQTLYKIVKRSDRDFDHTELCPCRFVPLLGPHAPS